MQNFFDYAGGFIGYYIVALFAALLPSLVTFWVSKRSGVQSPKAVATLCLLTMGLTATISVYMNAYTFVVATVFSITWFVFLAYAVRSSLRKEKNGTERD